MGLGVGGGKALWDSQGAAGARSCAPVPVGQVWGSTTQGTPRHCWGRGLGYGYYGTSMLLILNPICAGSRMWPHWAEPLEGAPDPLSQHNPGAFTPETGRWGFPWPHPPPHPAAGPNRQPHSWPHQVAPHNKMGQQCWGWGSGSARSSWDGAWIPQVRGAVLGSPRLGGLQVRSMGVLQS